MADLRTMDFPPQFYTIRASRARMQNISVLGNANGFERGESCVERRDAGFRTDGDARCFGVMNFHRTDVKQNISASVTIELGCLACDTQHSFRDSINAGTPLVVFLMDQAFPPILPAKDNKCVVVVQVEDGFLSEIENSFRDIFAEILGPNSLLPTGSVILIGSVSHMGAKGLGGPGQLHVLSQCGGRFGDGTYSGGSGAQQWDPGLWTD